jgi:hypothetical protein
LANGHGGYRKPANPAPVSGPGKLSRRTDGGPAQKLMPLSDQAYGAREDSLNQQRGAPMSQQDSIPTAGLPSGGSSSVGAEPIPGDAPSQRPGEPITTGVDIGPGAGPEALGMAPPKPTGYLTNMLQQMSASDTTGTLADLYVMAQQRGV